MNDFKPRPSLEHLFTIPTGLTKVWSQKKNGEWEMGKEPQKAETVSVVSETPGKVTVLILFDNVDEGRPTLYDVALPFVHDSLLK
jgi:hypothetical protein